MDAEKLARVKAGFVVNFVRYTTWPAASFDGPDSPFTITVIGSDRVADLLEDLAARTGAIAGGRGLLIDRAEVPPDPDPDERESVLERLRRSHVVYVGWPDGAPAMGLLSALAAHDVLTVGDAPGFAASGGLMPVAAAAAFFAAIFSARVTLSPSSSRSRNEDFFCFAVTGQMSR